MLTRTSGLLLALAALSACEPPRPPLAQTSLRLSVWRSAAEPDLVGLSLENGTLFPCDRLDATVTMNGLALAQAEYGIEPRQGTLFGPSYGCHPPRFERQGALDAIEGQPFELVLEAGDERVVVRSAGLLTVGYDVATTRTAPGGTLRFTPRGTFTMARPHRFVSISRVDGGTLPWSNVDGDVTGEVRSLSGALRQSGEVLEADVPTTLPPGEYRWELDTGSYQVPLACEGVGACVLGLSVDASGTFTVD